MHRKRVIYRCPKTYCSHDRLSRIGGSCTKDCKKAGILFFQRVFGKEKYSSACKVFASPSAVLNE